MGATAKFYQEYSILHSQHHPLTNQSVSFLYSYFFHQDLLLHFTVRSNYSKKCKVRINPQHEREQNTASDHCMIYSHTPNGVSWNAGVRDPVNLRKSILSRCISGRAWITSRSVPGTGPSGSHHIPPRIAHVQPQPRCSMTPLLPWKPIRL